MTAGCPGGGPSETKPGFGLAVAISASQLAAKFANTASWIGIFIAGYIGAITYDLSTFCPNDPPTVPTLTAADFAALILLGDPVASLQARLKIQQWIGAMVWFDLCQCIGGGTPAAPTPPAAPVGLPAVNPVTFPFPSATPCISPGAQGGTITGTQSFNRGGMSTNGVSGSWFRWRTTNTVISGGGVTIAYLIQQQGGSPLVDQRQDGVTLAPGGTATRIIPYFGPIVTNVNLKSTAISGAGVSRDDHFLDLFCNGDSPVVPISPCCPPDEALIGQIQSILATVTLIQRQLVPFAYIAGNVHSALTGSGSFAIQGILGAKISLTTVPSQLGRSGLLPEELFDAGFVTFSTPDGYPHSSRVEHNPQLVLPPRASVFTTFSYDLHPGVVATVTELIREP